VETEDEKKKKFGPARWGPIDQGKKFKEVQKKKKKLEKKIREQNRLGSQTPDGRNDKTGKKREKPTKKTPSRGVGEKTGQTFQRKETPRKKEKKKKKPFTRTKAMRQKGRPGEKGRVQELREKSLGKPTSRNRRGKVGEKKKKGA